MEHWHTSTIGQGMALQKVQSSFGLVLSRGISYMVSKLCHLAKMLWIVLELSYI